jgi:hypothetical protein
MGLLDRWRRPRDGDVDPRKALYVHLAWDGGIFVIRGETGEQLWVDRDGLDQELRAAKEKGGTLLYSREQGEQNPPAQVEETFQRIVDYRLPIMLLEEPHPQALVAPEERRTVTRE